MYDVALAVAFIYFFVTLNFYGWGMLHDQRFIFFALVISFLYIALSLFRTVRETFVLKIRILLLFVFILVAVFGITANLIQLRHITSVEGFINDSGLQTEIAGRFLLLEKNPYRESYETTDLAKARYIDEAGNTVNPALFHNAYPPLFLILSAVGFRIFSQAFGWFDIRVISLMFYLGLLVVGLVKFTISERLVLFLILVGMNPLFLSLMIQGSNDVAVFALLLWSLFFLERKRWILSGVLLGLAVATKQPAWIALPFYILYAWRWAPRKHLRRFLLSLGGTAAIIFAPFIAWDSAAMWEDMVLYITGSIPTSYPIHNFGLGMFLVKTWKIPTIYSYYPFWIWQVAIGGAVFCIWVWVVRRRKINAGDVLTGFVTLLSVSWIFNRFMNFSYLAALSAIVAAASLWQEEKKPGSMR